LKPSPITSPSMFRDGRGSCAPVSIESVADQPHALADRRTVSAGLRARVPATSTVASSSRIVLREKSRRVRALGQFFGAAATPCVQARARSSAVAPGATGQVRVAHAVGGNW
jgi:hypothetical protein